MHRTGPAPAPPRLLMTCLLAVASAALFGASYPPLSLWPLVVLAPVPLVWLALTAPTTRRAVLVVLVVQWLMWSTLQWWLVEVTLAGWPLFGLYMASYGGLFVWIIRRVHRHPMLGRVPMMLLVPVVWVGLEYLRGAIVFHGYSWFLLAHPVVEAPALAQSADLLGAYFVSFLVAFGAGGIVDALRLVGEDRPRVRVVVPVVAVAFVYAANAAYGAWTMGREGQIGPGPTLLVFQTNLAQDNKIGWSPERQRAYFANFVATTRTAFRDAGPGVDLVVWPETMLPGRGLEPGTLQTLQRWKQYDELRFAMEIVQLAADLDTPLLVGSRSFVDLEVDEASQRFVWTADFNSAYLITAADAPQRYDKFHLTPFGEVMPYISAWPWLEERLLAIGARGMSFSLDAAPEIRRLSMPGEEYEIATPICFEVTMPGVCRRMVYEDGQKRARLLVNLSNDGWFGSYEAGRVQHAQIARYRCIENRVPMVRAANTGVSISIDSSGRIVDAIGPGRYGAARRPGILLAPVRLDGSRTLYGRVGDVWGMFCLAATAIFMVATVLRPMK